MLISIILPIYNKEQYLNASIASAVNQSYQNIEIILINDGSTDQSDSIIKEWARKDSRIFFHNQENGGVSNARNKGMKLAKGKYIFFLDADDVIPKEAIYSLYNIAIKNHADIIMGNFYRNINGKMHKMQKHTKSSYSDNELILMDSKLELFIVNSRLLAMACNKLYKSEFLKKNKLKFNSDVLSEDRLFNLKCYTHSPQINSTEKYTYIYNSVEGSRSQTTGTRFINENINLIHLFNNYLQQNKLNNLSNVELLELVIILDVQRIIHRVFTDSQKKYKETNRVIYKLKSDEIISDGINSIFVEKKFKNSSNKSFNRMRMYCYLLYRYTRLIVLGKFLGVLKKKINKR